MDTIKALDELLPGFQKFLFELQKFDLTNDLQQTLSSYLKTLDSYVTDNDDDVHQDADQPMLPKLPPPPLPVSTPHKTAAEKENATNDCLSVDELAAQRTLSWQYSNVSSSGSRGNNSLSIESDDVYETPISEHEALQTKRSLSIPESEQEEYEVPTQMSTPIRTIDDDGEVYEEPDNVEDERIIDDMDLYENPEDQNDVSLTNGGWSDASGSYESFDSDEYVDEQQTTAPSLPQRDIPVQTRNSKAEQFKIRFENDPYIIHYGILSIKGYAGTLSRISLGKWSRKYCVVQKGLLIMYNKPSDKTPSKSLTLFGYDITEEGQDGKNEFVFGIHHQGQSTQYLSATSQEKLDKWIKVLKEESTNADNIPSDRDPHSPLLEVTDISLKDKIKIPNMLKRRSKAAPMLFTEDSDGNLAGVVNVLSPVHGEPKWKERFCLVTNQRLHIYKDTSGEKLVFTQQLQGMEIGQGKQTKRKNTLTLYQGETTYVYIEAVNHVDNGKLLCKLIKETGFAESMESDYITPLEVMEHPQVKNSKQTSIFSLMQRFETPTELEDSTKSEGRDSLYLEMEDSMEEAKPDTPSINVQETDTTEPVYENNSTRSAWLKSKLQPKKSPNIPRKDGKEKEKEKEKKEKKKKKKKEKEEKEKKASGEPKDADEAKEDGESKTESGVENSRPEASTTEDVSQVKVKDKVSEAPKIENKFVKSDKKHLLDVDRLQGERTLLLERREDLRIKKIDLRGRRNACEDETKKAKIQNELTEAIQEWTNSSKELTDLEEKIEKLSKGDEVLKVESFGNKSASGRASPMLQRAISSKNVMARAKMFEAMGKD